MKGCKNDLHIPPFFKVELLIQQGPCGNITHTQIHTSTCVYSVLQKCLDQDIDDSGELNETGKL